MKESSTGQLDRPSWSWSSLLPRWPCCAASSRQTAPHSGKEDASSRATYYLLGDMPILKSPAPVFSTGSHFGGHLQMQYSIVINCATRTVKTLTVRPMLLDHALTTAVRPTAKAAYICNFYPLQLDLISIKFQTIVSTLIYISAYIPIIVVCCMHCPECILALCTLQKFCFTSC